MRSILLLSLLVPALLSCTAAPPPDADVSGGAGAESEQWEAAGLEDYRFDFQQQCFCVRDQVQPVTIEVRGGRVVRVISRETGADMTTVEGLRWPTVPDLFRVMSEARENGVTPLIVRYDPQLGYPAHIEAGSLAADAGIIYTVSNLAPLPR